ncbi:MAG: phosphoribosyltransferase [Steroidobacter sp.]
MLREATVRFLHRRDAGRRLAAELKARSIADPVVLALPRGGVPVGYEVATALDAPLDVLLVRKLGAPGHEEFGIGAVVDGAQPQMVLNEEAIEALRVSPAYIAEERDRQLAEIERRRRMYCGDGSAVSIEGRTAIVVDDGVATGGTVLVVLRALHSVAPERTVLAVPVAPPDTLARLAAEVDEVICLATPQEFRAVGVYYSDFTQTSDEEVIELLAQRRAAVAAKCNEYEREL